MEILSYSDILALNHAIGEIYAVPDLESFYTCVFNAILGIIPFDLCSFNDVNLETSHFLGVISATGEQPAVPGRLQPIFNTPLRAHPLLPHGCAGSDTPFSQPAEKAVSGKCYRHPEVEMQLSVAIPVSGKKVSLLALNRKSENFSERDRLILTLLRPHLIKVLRHARSSAHLRLKNDLLQEGVETGRRGVILATAEGRSLSVSSAAAEMFLRYFGRALGEGDSLPQAVLGWFETELHLRQAGADESMAPAPASFGSSLQWAEREPFSIESDGKVLKLRLRHDVVAGDHILLLEEIDQSQWLLNLRSYGVSRRETDVLHWLSKGKTNAEIAEILNMSRRTVEKHLEHLFAKLGVETRTAAVAALRSKP